MSKHGRCLCGAVTFAYEGDENWCSHCHCDSCRRQTSSPFTTFVSVQRANFVWTSARPATFESSVGVRRSFCRDCGTPMGYENDKYADEMHLYLASIEPHPDLTPPEQHDFWDERVSWVELTDDLPKR